MAAQGLQFGPEVVLEQTAIELEETADGYLLRTNRGLELPTRTLVISAGAGAFSPTRIGVDREEEFEGKGLYYGVKEKSVFAGRRIGIVGGGDSAFDWILNLHEIAGEMTLIHRRDQFRAHEESVAQVMGLPIRKRLFCVVRELNGSERLEGVVIENTQTNELERLDLDAVIVNIGFKSSLGPIKEWGLEIEKNQIVVDRLCETNRKGVFAVGDVCTFEGKLKLIATGVGEAARPGSKAVPGT
jgi:ferredoxin/flavodoxin---NADP+ reductase